MANNKSVAVLTDTRKDEGGVLARMVRPYDGNFWTNIPGSVGMFTMAEARDIVNGLRYNNPRIVDYDEAVTIIRAQRAISKAHS